MTARTWPWRNVRRGSRSRLRGKTVAIDPRGERDRADYARLARARAADDQLWLGARPACAPAGTLVNRSTGRSVSHPVYVLSPDNFDRAEQAIALCLAHGLLR